MIKRDYSVLNNIINMYYSTLFLLAIILNNRTFFYKLLDSILSQEDHLLQSKKSYRRERETVLLAEAVGKEE